jgi:hypothetical protein
MYAQLTSFISIPDAVAYNLSISGLPRVHSMAEIRYLILPGKSDDTFIVFIYTF